MISNQLKPTEYNVYYKSYIDNAADTNIVKGLKANFETVCAFYKNLPLEKHQFAYAEGKWTVKDILLHIVDTERIFAYRALRIARLDNTPLAGYEQDPYVANGKANTRSLENIIEEYSAVRQATIALFSSFDETVLIQIGEASGFPISVRAIGYMITGHENHHTTIIKERYL